MFKKPFSLHLTDRYCIAGTIRIEYQSSSPNVKQNFA